MEIFPKLGHFVVKDDDDVDDDMGCSSQPQGICPLLVSDPGIISLPTERGSSKKLDDDQDDDDDYSLVYFFLCGIFDLNLLPKFFQAFLKKKYFSNG